MNIHKGLYNLYKLWRREHILAQAADPKSAWAAPAKLGRVRG